MTSSVFLDINVWLALSSPDHRHFGPAWAWYKGLPPSTVLLFCRITQLGLLRLLTTEAVMGRGTLTQAQAWDVYDRLLATSGAEFVDEPAGMEAIFRSLSGSQQASPKDWADAYLSALSFTARFPLVTFDRALARKARGAILIG